MANRLTNWWADEERKRDSVIAELIVNGYVTLSYSEVDKLGNDELTKLYGDLFLAEERKENRNKEGYGIVKTIKK